MKWDGVGLHFFLTSKIMLIGEYVHTLDPKKRLSLPSRFRKEVGKKVVITRGLDHCLLVSAGSCCLEQLRQMLTQTEEF